MTREEAIRRLEHLVREITELKTGLEVDSAAEIETGTRAFLEKCRGWEDTRTPEKIVADIYEARVVSDRGAAAFDKLT